MRRRTSGPFGRPLAEQTLGAEDEDQDQDREHDRLRPVVPGVCQVRPSLNAWMRPIRDRPRTAPGRLPIPPRTAAVNAIKPSWKPVSKRTSPEYSAKSRPAAPASAPAMQEGRRDRPVDVHPHLAAASRPGPSRASPCPAASSGRATRPDEHRNRHEEDDQPVQCVHDASIWKMFPCENTFGIATGRALPDDRDVLEDERDPIAWISGARRGAPRNGRYATNHSTRRGDRTHHRNDEARRASARDSAPGETPADIPNSRRDEHRGGDHPAEHEDVAVREVDQLEDAVDERVAERDERVERALGEPDEGDGGEVVSVRLDDVHDEPGRASPRKQQRRR